MGSSSSRLVRSTSSSYPVATIASSSYPVATIITLAEAVGGLVGRAFSLGCTGESVSRLQSHHFRHLQHARFTRSSMDDAIEGSLVNILKSFLMLIHLMFSSIN